MAVINETISGRLTLWKVACHFVLTKGCFLEITPDNDGVEKLRDDCRERGNNFDNLGALHGKDKFKHDYAFIPAKVQGPFCFYRGVITLVIDIVITTINTKKSDGSYLHKYEDLNGFTAIDFSGEAVDSILNPKAIIDRQHGLGNRIEWKANSEVAKSFSTSISGHKCQLIFTVVSDQFFSSLDRNTIATLKTIMRIEFEERQSTDKIIDCWRAACYFLSFCTGCFNVTDLQIGLWDTDDCIGTQPWHSTIDCFINSQKIESVHFEEDPYYRFLIASLGDKTGNVFSILNNDETKPSIGFLRKTNDDVMVDRDKIRDLCTAFEVEFEYQKGQIKDVNIELLVGRLKETVKTFRSENPTSISERDYGYIFGTLNFISMPARKKIGYIYQKYSSMIDERIKHHAYGIDVSPEKTEEDIGWLVKSRNNITHSTGISEDAIPNAIFARLKIAVYCSVLERAGYSLDEIKVVLNMYFKYE